MSPQQAEAIAVAAFAYIAEDAGLARRFLALSGLEDGDLRQAAREPPFLAGVLDFVMAHEPVLLAFAAAANLAATDIEAAQRLLTAGGDEGRRPD